MSVHKYSVTPDSNTSVGDGSDAVGLQEGMPRQNVNNAMRAIASDIAKNYKDHGSLVTAGTGTAYTVFAQSDFTAYFIGLSLVVKLHANCGANATINVNGRGAKQLRMRGPNGVTNVEANALRANEVVHIVYNGTQFHVVGAFNYASVLADISAIQGSYVRGDNVDNGTTTIRVDDADFVVSDTTDGTTNFIWRDHSASKLYLGASGSAVATLRSNLDFNGYNFAGDLMAANGEKVGSNGAYIENGEILWGNGHHRLTDNDGGGNANVRFGHYYDGGEKTAQAGGSGVHLEAAVDGSTSTLTIDLLTSGAAVGDPISSAKALVMSANGSFTWGGSTIWHAGNDGAASGLDSDLLDGVQGANYARRDVANTFAADATFDRNVTITAVNYGLVVNSDTTLRTFATLKQGATTVNSMQITAAGDTNFDLASGKKFLVDGSEVMHKGNDGAGSGFDADLLDGAQGSAYVRGDSNNNGNTQILVNDADFVVKDTTDGVTNFIYRDHSSGRFYLGTPQAELSFRSKLWLNDGNFGGLDVGRGTVYLEDNASDGDGSGLCFRASVNPTGSGMIFSVRSSGQALGFGVGQDYLMSQRADMYLSASQTGSGGNRVHHAGVAAGSIGSYMFANNNSGGTVSFGVTVAGSSLRPTSAGDPSQTGYTPQGTWRCMGYKTGGNTSFGGTHESTLWLRIS